MGWSLVNVWSTNVASPLLASPLCKYHFNPYPADSFVQKNVSLICLLPLQMEANTMNPDQAAPKQHSDLGP